MIVYNRNVCRLTAPLLERLAERCPNLIGYKDGLGDIELMVSIRRRLGAGITGLSAAHSLAQLHPQARIVIVDRQRAAQGASARWCRCMPVITCHPKTRCHA